MQKLIKTLLLSSALLSTPAFADVVLGYISYDVNIPASTATFDIFNGTGANASTFPDMTFPVTTPVTLSDLSLVVHFSNGTVVTEPSSYFTLALDGLSWNGGTIPIGGSNPQPTEGVLTGMLSPTSLTLNDGSKLSVKSSFSTATILPSSPPDLMDGDFALITASPVSSVPEPGFRMFFAGLVVMLIAVQSLRSRSGRRKLEAALRQSATVLGVMMTTLIVAQTMHATTPVTPVKLGAATNPSTGVAGVSFVNVTGSGFPVGHGTLPPADATLSFSLTCGGAVAATTNPATIIQIVGSSYRLHFQLPATLTTNNYFISLTGTTSDGTQYASTNCSEVAVTHTNPTLSACVPASSLGIIAPAKGPAAVKALVPNSAWNGAGKTGIQVVQLETGGGPAVPAVSIPTTVDVNSCAGNPATGEGVCTANTTAVFVIDSSNTVTTLTSSSDRTTGFSGGSCNNCGVAMNALTNQAVITIGHTTSPSGSALQTLNLATNTFDAPFDVHHEVSENISVDPTRGFVLSADEQSVYDLAQINSMTGAFTGEFGMSISKPSLELDSSAEDCSTGIALSVGEFSNFVVLSDLTQAVLTPGTPGTWTAPTSETSIIGSYAAGLSGSTVAQGTSHLATVTGEFGGSSFAVLELPSTSGSGTPAIEDYAVVPCLTGFSAGFDPHTLSAYTSPNNGKAYTVFANWTGGFPQSVYVVDMAGVLGLPREGDGHTVIGDGGAGTCLSPGDGLVTSISTLP